MGKIIIEHETPYNVGDIVIFKRHDRVLEVGIIEGYYMDDRTFWFNIRISPTTVYTYSNGDIAEFDIVGKVEDPLYNICKDAIFELR